MSDYPQLIKNKNFIRFWFAQLISQFGDRINQMALLGLIGTRVPGTAIDLAKLMSFTIIPVFIVGPVAGALVDRWDRKTTLFVCDLLRGLLVLFVPILFLTDYQTTRWGIIPIYTIIFLVFSLSRFYVVAKMAIIPDLVPKEHLHTANSMAGVSGFIALMIGALLGGFVVDAHGSRVGFMVDVVTFFLSAALIASIVRKRFHIDKDQVLQEGREVISTFKKTIFHDVWDSFKYIASHGEIRSIMKVMGLLLMAAGAIYVVIVVFIQESFGSVTKDLGVLAVAFCVGAFLGITAYGKWGKKKSNVETIFNGLIAGGAMIGLFTIFVQSTHSLWVAFVLAVILGSVVGPIAIASYTIIHHVCTEEMRAKVFSALEIVMHLGFLIMMFASAYLAEMIGRFWILLLVGIVLIVVGIIGRKKYKGKWVIPH